jgi:putative transcriptional regulator
MELGNTIRRWRFDAHEMSQQELADLIGVSRMTIYSIEKGNYTPSTLLALKIARVFNTSVEEIFFIDDKEPKNE